MTHRSLPLSSSFDKLVVDKIPTKEVATYFLKCGFSLFHVSSYCDKVAYVCPNSWEIFSVGKLVT